MNQLPQDYREVLANARRAALSKANLVGGRPSALTPEVHAEIVMMITAGNFAHVAAQAAGIPLNLFSRWMNRGATEWEQHEARTAWMCTPDCDGEQHEHCVRACGCAGNDHERDCEVAIPSRFAAFWYDVARARAKARGNAEARVFKDKPDVWLMRGPGRQGLMQGDGWADGAAKVAVAVQSNVGTPGTFDLKQLPQGDLDELERIAARAAVVPALPDGNQG